MCWGVPYDAGVIIKSIVKLPESVMRRPVCGFDEQTGFGYGGVRCSGSPDLAASPASPAVI